ncbi:hypothetical protein [Salicibibacter kimchii]|uniref:Nuclear transport factor 2 family protein n=1 Tax=Salicibibacter kimchii TaxID=2099786 RepID=A0A345BYU8_9BACI|nr:hypothetical protein [Salicibibacter kimchii]AXF56129.1 hypothetical protein DT065_08905 [Salicibibacter kimchii]
MKIKAAISLSFLIILLAMPTFVQSAEMQSPAIQKPKPFVEDTFAGDAQALILTLKAVQNWTHQFLDMDEGEIDSETGAHMVEELQDFFTEEMALNIYNQFHRPHLAKYEEFDDYIEVDSLVHRDIEESKVDYKGDEIIVRMQTSSVEDGAGNRAHFEETFTFSYDKEREAYVIGGMESEQVL